MNAPSTNAPFKEGDKVTRKRHNGKWSILSGPDRTLEGKPKSGEIYTVWLCGFQDGEWFISFKEIGKRTGFHAIEFEKVIDTLTLLKELESISEPQLT